MLSLIKKNLSLTISYHDADLQNQYRLHPLIMLNMTAKYNDDALLCLVVCVHDL